ncbi:Fe-S cluster assembly protein SufD [Flexivirga endophytica]|uniref:Fe-S cluster assembly protein SufD n=1 Tax=Flexivirga endophytica TaxID=1849103 RepID=A0A916T6V0_9MICO|nr:Fe-S cluster assembly protein SufD [Flexivirga endophytica]GGB34182.1 Fe-S cluster assembly protein SufD [Flexivirga endophytica]GHB42147.1 Fe-S cluster assembly protein SufD [Flexivirga endophytica]
MSLLTPDAKTHVDPAAQASVPEKSRAERKTSFDVADFPLPHGREEDWRFTPVDRLTGLLADEPTADGAVTVEVSDQSVVAEPLAADEGVRGTALVPGDRASALAHANSAKALHLKLDAETEYDEPLRVTVHGNAGKRSNGHVVIEAGVHSKGLVILEHTGSGEHTANVEVVVGDGAHLTVVSLQQWDDDALHLAQHEALVGRDATYRHIAVTLGGKVVRINSNVKYDGPGGDATLLGVYFADAGQHLEHRTFIDHNAARTKSLVTYKGALQGESAHSVWVGDVLIRAEAEGIETYELNRNLVLTDGARADSVPNLEIETGEIAGAGHASSTGRFDDEQLFYLQARGIPEGEARRLVVRGFFADVISKIGVPAVVEPLMEAIDAELAAGAQV